MCSEEENNAGRRQISVMSSSDEVTVGILWGAGGEGFSAEMIVNEWINVHIKLDVHLTDDSSSDC